MNRCLCCGKPLKAQKSAEKMIAKIASLKEKYIEMCGLAYMPEGRKAALNALTDERLAVLMKTF